MPEKAGGRPNASRATGLERRLPTGRAEASCARGVARRSSTTLLTSAQRHMGWLPAGCKPPHVDCQHKPWLCTSALIMLGHRRMSGTVNKIHGCAPRHQSCWGAAVCPGLSIQTTTGERRSSHGEHSQHCNQTQHP